MNWRLRTILGGACIAACLAAEGADVKARVNIKQPGMPAVTHELADRGNRLESASALPLVIGKKVEPGSVEGEEVLTLTLKANGCVWFNLGLEVETGIGSDNSEFYLPGFWYHRNLRSPREAPSFHTSKSWNFREDRLSSPLSGVYDMVSGQWVTVLRQEEGSCDALTTAQEGEVMLSGNTTVGYMGFDNDGATARLTFGYPYVESPRRYIRKLTLAPQVQAFVKMEKGEVKTLKWSIRRATSGSYGDFVARTWEYCFDRLNPQPLEPLYTPERMKAELSNYFRASYVDRYDLKYNSGLSLRVDDCKPCGEVQLGFCGRVVLNGFNALEYGEATGQQDLVRIGQSIFDSFLEHGFTEGGYFLDFVNYRDGRPADKDVVHSIRQQSEGAYAVLHYLAYEKKQGRKHKEWEQKIRTLLDNFVKLLKPDGSFARKFHDDGSDIDATGGSTPSATSTLVMGYKYFGDKRYLEAAKRTVDYLEKNIISKSDYFSSTLDANCEDKEAAISAVTATYYMAMVTKGADRQHYTELCRKAAYFALSWYYLWDVPFAQGQMLGDLGLKSRGWGNVSVENNHIDVFVFELPHIVNWLGETLGEDRFVRFCYVVASSLCQLLPIKDRLCGVGVEGFYPEVVQHTTWDYGRNGKGFYNDIFAPGWTIASLWELYSPTRTSDFLTKKK